MLRYLLDEHFSPAVAEHILRARPEIIIFSIYRWRGGALIAAQDEPVLLAALEDQLTLISYDQKTIPSLLTRFGDIDQDHAGVILIDERTIAQSDIGTQIRGIIQHWDGCNGWDWLNRIDYLRHPD